MTAKEQRKAAEDFAAKWLGRGYEKGECQKFWRGLLHDVFGGVRLRPGGDGGGDRRAALRDVR